MEIEGIIKVLKPLQELNQKFKKRDLVLLTNETYQQLILLEFNQSGCELLDKFKVGDAVKVYINLRGRSWTSPSGEVKYFNTIQGWKIDLLKDVIPAYYKEEKFVPSGTGIAINDVELPF